MRRTRGRCPRRLQTQATVEARRRRNGYVTSNDTDISISVKASDLINLQENQRHAFLIYILTFKVIFMCLLFCLLFTTYSCGVFYLNQASTRRTRLIYL